MLFTCRSVWSQGQLHDLAVRLTHVRRCRIAIDVHGCADVRVPHEFLLDSNWSFYCVNPHAVRVPECVRADVTDT
jgi:hypothetical protein